jgi:hypothetical protein
VLTSAPLPRGARVAPILWLTPIDRIARTGKEATGMNRRMALLTTLLSGGLLPARLYAQTQSRARRDPEDSTEDSPYRRPRGPGATRVARRDDDELLPEDDESTLPPAEEAPAEGMPADLPTEPGQVFRTFDIRNYTSLPHDSTSPQDALIEWIFRRTHSSTWHGDKIAVLCASQSQLRAYHTPKVLRQVEEMVERFTDAQPSNILKIRARFVAATDTRWRYAVAARLSPIASGPQGQQVWSLDAEEAAMVRTQMQVYQGFKLLLDQERKLINGQTLSIAREMDVDYISGPQRDSAVGLGFQPGTAKLKEGVFLRVSPLLTYEGDAIDLALDLRANTVKSLIPTRIMTRREIGPADMSIDVPEVVESRLNQTIQNWKLGRTLVIACGIHPGILQSKTGFLNLRIPGTVPTRTELIVTLDAETVGDPPRTARRNDG